MFRPKFPCTIVLLEFVLIMAIFHVGSVTAQSTTHPANSIWVDPAAFVFDQDNGSVGTAFNLTAWISTNESSYTWQVGIYFNASLFQATSVSLTAGDTSEFFQGHTTATYQQIDNASGNVLVGETLLGNDSIAAGNGTLMQTTFEIIGAPNSTSTSSGNFSIDVNNETFVWDYDLVEMNLTGSFGATYLFTYLGDTIPPTVVTVTQAPPESNVVADQNVTVSANVTDDFGGSGVAGVVLSYSENNVTFTNETMIFDAFTKLWVGVIPGYPNGTTVYYLIYAYDNAGNAAISNNNTANWSYTVIVPEFPSTFLIVMLLVMTMVVLRTRKRIEHESRTRVSLRPSL
jgi:hypothetical protein